MVVAGALIAVVPLVGVFLIGSRHLIANIAAERSRAEADFGRLPGRDGSSKTDVCPRHTGVVCRGQSCD